MKTCTVEECDGKRVGRGYCNRHWLKWRRYGDPLGSFDWPSRMDRFLALTNKDAPPPSDMPELGNCWNWVGFINGPGYGMFNMGSGTIVSSRAAWILFNGEIPNGMVIDHVCRNRKCVNPSHLRTVTRGQNSKHRDSQSSTSSGYRGVYFDKESGRWRANATFKYKRYHIGYFDDVEDAAEAVRNFRNQIHTHNYLDRRAA